MYSILIADDETIIRQGLKCIIDWENLGFSNIEEASNGDEALTYIRKNKPDVLLLDIRMPKLSGLEVVRQARTEGYEGKIIILSGYSDFTYAQEAIAGGVQYYLTKPIDEEELFQIMLKVKEQLETEKAEKQKISIYKQKAKEFLLYDLLHGNMDFDSIDLEDVNLIANNYQVIIYEKYGHEENDASYNFADLLRVTNHKNNTFDSIQFENRQVILLKGDYALSRFQYFLERYQRQERPQKDSPLDSIFVAYGRSVTKINDIYISFEDAELLLSRRFFCTKNQHTLGYQELPPENINTFQLGKNELAECCDTVVNYIQACNKIMLSEFLKDLESKFYHVSISIDDIKMIMTDLYLLVREKIYHLYNKANIPFLSNASIINTIDTSYYLYEIFDFLKKQFQMIMNTIGNTSGDNTIDSIIHYIKHNYMNNIKLETIAPLFGYNSSYLGKIFNKKTGSSFNAYVDNVRIEQSKKLLEHEKLKVYEIAERVGYQNVDYFHMKFKKHTGMSPAEYRKHYKTKN